MINALRIPRADKLEFARSTGLALIDSYSCILFDGGVHFTGGSVNYFFCPVSALSAEAKHKSNA